MKCTDCGVPETETPLIDGMCIDCTPMIEERFISAVMALSLKNRPRPRRSYLFGGVPVRPRKVDM